MKYARFPLLAILIAGLCPAAGTAQAAIAINMVTVGNPVNAADDRAGYGGYGKVDYAYKIGTYEVTNAQYAAFLNAVAADDTYGLYNTNMWSNGMGCKIERLGSPGSYTYQVAADRANRPVNYVSWGDSARFTNWLHNNQPSGAQVSGTTEDGAYNLDGANDINSLMLVSRNSGAKYRLATIDEWYKAAFYDPQKEGGPGYWDYATQSNTVPSNVFIDPDPGNSANFRYNSTYTIGSPYYSTPVGEFEKSAGAFGTFDMNGNLFEWLETASSSTSRLNRGGSFVVNESQLIASHVGNANSPTLENYHIGIRIAAPVPEPGCLALLLSALAAAWLWKRHAK